MPRSGATYTRPSSTTAVTGSPITSTAWNAILSDMETEITASMNTGGDAVMTGSLKHNHASMFRNSSAAGAASGCHNPIVHKTGIADNTATAVITVPVAVRLKEALLSVLPAPPSVIVPIAALPVARTTAPVLQAVTLPSIEESDVLPVVCAVLVAGLLRDALVTALTQGLSW